MLEHFVPLDEVEIHGKIVEIFNSSVSQEELVAFLKPLIVTIYNQFLKPPERPISRAQLPRIQALLTSHMPTTDNLKKAEFGEVLATLFLRDIKGRIVPVYKHSHKTARNMPVHGIDCIAFLITEETEDEVHLIVCLCEVKTTESETPYPTVCYQIRDTFQEVSPEMFDAEIAFVLRHLQNKDELEPRERLIIQSLWNMNYADADILFIPFLLAEENTYQNSFPVPFCRAEYGFPLESIVIRISDLDEVYTSAMAVSNV